MRKGALETEIWVLDYTLHSQGPSVATEEEQFLKEEAYKCLNRRITTVTRGACNQSEIAFLQIADEQKVVTTMAFPHLLTPVCLEEPLLTGTQTPPS